MIAGSDPRCPMLPAWHDSAENIWEIYGNVYYRYISNYIIIYDIYIWYVILGNNCNQDKKQKRKRTCDITYHLGGALQDLRSPAKGGGQGKIHWPRSEDSMQLTQDGSSQISETWSRKKAGCRLPLWICVCFALVHWSLQHLFCGQVVSCCWKTCLTAPASLPMGNLGVRMDGVNRCDGRAWVCSSFLFGCHDSKRFANFPYQFDENHLFCKYLQDMCIRVGYGSMFGHESENANG